MEKKSKRIRDTVIKYNVSLIPNKIDDNRNIYIYVDNVTVE